MPKFVFAFHGVPDVDTPEAGQKMMNDWQAWNASLTLADEGHPVGMSKTVTKDGVRDDGGPSPLSGYTIIEADNIDAACEAAKGCPLVTNGWGSVEVAECMSMSMDG